jgi:hypothetical protein
MITPDHLDGFLFVLHRDQAISNRQFQCFNIHDLPTGKRAPHAVPQKQLNPVHRNSLDLLAHIDSSFSIFLKTLTMP